MKRRTWIWIGAAAVVGGLVVAAAYFMSPEQGFATPHGNQRLTLRTVSSAQFHVEPAHVEENAPQLHSLFEEAIRSGQATMRDRADIASSLAYLDGLGWNRNEDVEYRGRFFSVSYSPG